MNKDLEEIVQIYATQSHNAVDEYLNDKSKNNVKAMLIDLLTEYFNDKNSSKLREYVVVKLAGYEVHKGKIGYNGYRQSGVNIGSLEHCEVKPKNINTNDEKPKKLDGTGNFTDYTWARFERDKQENLVMLVAGFIDGQLVFIFEFPFSSPSFVARLNSLLMKRFPNGDISGEYLRSASFRLFDWGAVDGIKTVYVMNRDKLFGLQRSITKTLYNYLYDKAK